MGNCPCTNEVIVTASGNELAVLGKGHGPDGIRVLEWLPDRFECRQVKEPRCLIESCGGKLGVIGSNG